MYAVVRNIDDVITSHSLGTPVAQRRWASPSQTPRNSSRPPPPPRLSSPKRLLGTSAIDDSSTSFGLLSLENTDGVCADPRHDRCPLGSAASYLCCLMHADVRNINDVYHMREGTPTSAFRTGSLLPTRQRRSVAGTPPTPGSPVRALRTPTTTKPTGI